MLSLQRMLDILSYKTVDQGRKIHKAIIKILFKSRRSVMGSGETRPSGLRSNLALRVTEAFIDMVKPFCPLLQGKLLFHSPEACFSQKSPGVRVGHQVQNLLG